ncbi:unnamed protein product [Effrenium voratum]|nr:unnamed protein product [Effrenium voratum]
MAMETMKGRSSRGACFRLLLSAIPWRFLHTGHLFTIVPHGQIARSRPGLKDSRRAQVRHGGVALRASSQQDPLAIMANSEHTVEGLLRLRACLKGKLPASVHAEPNDGEFQARPLESQEFLNRVSKMLEYRSRSGSLHKADSPLLEYATMSGAGKSRWGFEMERLLKRHQSFRSYAVSRIGLNFNRGAGEGGVDGSQYCT